MSSRAVFLPTPGDPFLLTYWLDLCKERWIDEFDKLYVCLNTKASKEVVDYIVDIVDKFPKETCIIVKSKQIEHGDAINELLNECEEDLVMLVEDDCYIFKSGHVDQQFKKLELGEFDLIGSRRGSCSSWLINQANARWNLHDEDVEGDTGPNFWPNLLFTDKGYLQATDRNFAAKHWEAGAIVHPFELEAPMEQASDTFVWASMQLREMGLRVGYVPQYHGSPDDLDHYQRGKFLFDGFAPWVHVGSLSSGFGGMLSDKPLPDYANTDAEKREMERRVQFWAEFADHYIKSGDTRLEKEVKQYNEWLAKIIVGYKLQPKNIQRRRAIYQELMQWT